MPSKLLSTSTPSAGIVDLTRMLFSSHIVAISPTPETWLQDVPTFTVGRARAMAAGYEDKECQQEHVGAWPTGEKSHHRIEPRLDMT